MMCFEELATSSLIHVRDDGRNSSVALTYTQAFPMPVVSCNKEPGAWNDAWVLVIVMIIIMVIIIMMSIISITMMTMMMTVIIISIIMISIGADKYSDVIAAAARGETERVKLTSLRT